MKKNLILGVALAMALAGFAAAQTASPFLIPSKYAPERGRAGGTVTLSLFHSGGVPTLNPFVTRDTLSAGVIDTFLAAPLAIRFIDNVWRPYAAESFEVAPDFRSITYRLRRGIRWSDGRPLTAEDYLLSFNIHADKAVNSNSYAATFVGDSQTRAVRIDDFTIRFEFGEVPFSAVGKSVFSVAPAHVFGPVYRERGADGVTKMWTVDTPPAQLIAIAAWRMTAFTQAERIVWERNPNFDWVRLEVAPGDRLPYLEGFTQIMVPAIDQQLALFLGGTAAEFAPANADHLRAVIEARQTGRLDIQVFPNYSPAASSQFITFNFNHLDPWKANLYRNVNFRRAMSHLTDRAGMVEAGLGGLGRPLHSPVYPVWPAIYREFVKFDFNPERAVELLRGLGFTRKDREGFLIDGTGRRLEFNLTTNSGNPVREAIGRVFTAEAAAVGVKVNFQPVAFGVLVAQLTSWAVTEAGTPNDRGWDAIIIGLAGGNPDNPIGRNVWEIGATLHFWNMYRPGEPGAAWAPWEIELDRISKLADVQPDDAKRGELIDRFQRVAQENLPMIQTISPNIHLAHLTNLGGFYPTEFLNAFYGTAFRVGGAAGYNWFLRR